MDRQIQWLSIALIISSTAVILEAQQTFVHGDDVAFAIQTDQPKYMVTEPITIRYSIRNVSNGPVFVPKSQWSVRCGDPPFLWARLEDKSGKHYEPGYAGSCLGRRDRMSVPERMARDAVLLQPGQVVRGYFTFQPKVLGDLRSGSYRLEAILYGWNPSLFTASELPLLRQLGAPLLIGETRASRHIEVEPASRN